MNKSISIFAMTILFLVGITYVEADDMYSSKPSRFDYSLCCSLESDCQSLGNSICDANLNREECAWDKGDCGFCAPGCFESMINNGLCEPECNVLQCQFDKWDCTENMTNYYSSYSLNQRKLSNSECNLTEFSDFIKYSNEAEDKYCNNFTVNGGNENFLIFNTEMIAKCSINGDDYKTSVFFENDSKIVLDIKANKNLGFLLKSLQINTIKDSSFSFDVEIGEDKNDQCKISIELDMYQKSIAYTLKFCDNITFEFSSENLCSSVNIENSSVKMTGNRINLVNSDCSNKKIISLQNSVLKSDHFLSLQNGIFTNTSLISALNSIITAKDIEINNVSQSITLIEISDNSTAEFEEFILNNNEQINNIIFYASKSVLSIKNMHAKAVFNDTTLELNSSSFIMANFSIENEDASQFIMKSISSRANFYQSPAYINEEDFKSTDYKSFTNGLKPSLKNNTISFCNSEECLKPSEPCQNGYVRIGGICQPCNENSFSYHQKNTEAISCFECTSNMSCHDNIISPKPGVWRHDNQSENDYYLVFRECPFKDACVNNYEDNAHDEQNKYQFGNFTRFVNSRKTICAKGYKGQFCHSCGDNYTKTSLHRCSECIDNYKNVLIILALVFLIFFVFGLLIKCTITTNFTPEELYSIGLKIIINYIQIILLCLQFKIAWPREVQQLKNPKTSNKSENQKESSTTDYFFSFKCLWNRELPEEDLYYYRIYFVMVLPIIVLGFSVLFAVIILFLDRVYINLCNRRRVVNNNLAQSNEQIEIKDKVDQLKSQNFHMILKMYFNVALIVPFFFVYPTILTYSLSPLACQSLVNGKQDNFDEKLSTKDYREENYLIENRNIKCKWDNHYSKILWSTLFGVLIWGFAVPLYVFIKLYKMRKNLYFPEAKYKFGFLFNGYRHSRYYWEFVILAKKFIIVLLTVFMQADYSVNLQSVFIITFLIICFILQLYFKPYINEDLNNIEIFATVAAIITIMMGIIYADSTVQKGTSQLIIVIIFLTNILFVLYWLKYMLKSVKETIIQEFECLKKRFHKKDPFSQDISREFVELPFLYMKESHLLYTQINEVPLGSENYLGKKIDSMKSLFLEIIKADKDAYIDNIAPNIRADVRKESIFVRSFPNHH